MRRTRTMLMGDLLDEFFRRPYVAAKVAEGKLPETWRAVVGDRAADQTTELRLENRITSASVRACCAPSCSAGAMRCAMRSTPVRACASSMP